MQYILIESVVYRAVVVSTTPWLKEYICCLSTSLFTYLGHTEFTSMFS